MEALTDLAEAVGTPFYVYDADVFRARSRHLGTALRDVSHLICYSAKANDALALLALAGREGLGVDIVSGGELWKALRAGVPGERIVFSGVGKRADEIRAALEAGVRSLNVESPGELDAIIVEARSLGLVAPVSVRLNPDVEPRTHGYVSTGQATSKFGLPGPEVLAGLRRAAHEPSLRPVGISFHIGSQLTDPAPVLVAAERALELWRELAAGGVRLRDLDVGGGWESRTTVSPSSTSTGTRGSSRRGPARSARPSCSSRGGGSSAPPARSSPACSTSRTYRAGGSRSATAG